jgi:hypothetical protein
MACAYKPALSSTKTAFTEIYMKKRIDKNSATAVVTGSAGVADDAILPPAGVELRSDKEHLIWSQFTRARAKSDWRDMDLILLAKIVRMEADIRAAQTELDAMGMMVENKRGTQIPNPLILVIDTLERRQLAVIRSMSLNQTASDPHTIKGIAKFEAKARATLKKVGMAGLIARPTHKFMLPLLGRFRKEFLSC